MKPGLKCTELNALISFMQLFEIVGEPMNILEPISSSDVMMRWINLAIYYICMWMNVGFKELLQKPYICWLHFHAKTMNSFRACCGRQVIQTICTNCGRSGESEETSFYGVNLPCSERQTVESRLMNYYESDMEMMLLSMLNLFFVKKRSDTKFSMQTGPQLPF